TNLLTIQPGSARGPGNVRTGAGGAPTLTDQDVQAILKQVPGIQAVTSNLDAGNVQVVAGNQNWSTRVQANGPAVFSIQDWEMGQGQAFDQTDEDSSALVCDIGQTVATNL